MNKNKVDLYILQTLYGALPQDLWRHRSETKKPFEGFSSEEKRLAKRKFRKLKRKAGVKPSDSTHTMWSKINFFLKEKWSRSC
tara:strand:- start:11907 stop:12155 length:249 start_codon:yes stop_codon:yes gene_type:complete